MKRMYCNRNILCIDPLIRHAISVRIRSIIPVTKGCFISVNIVLDIILIIIKKLRGLSQHANYTDRVTAACQRSQCQLFADRGCHVVGVTNPYGRIFGFLDRSSSSVALTRLSAPHSRPTTFFCSAGNRIRDLRIYSQELWPIDHRGGHSYYY
jgi:hypothetical protein